MTHCSICNTFVDTKDSILDYCSYTCYLTTLSESETYMDVVTMYNTFNKTDFGKCSVDIHYKIFSYLVQYRKCKRCKVVFDLNSINSNNNNINNNNINDCSYCSIECLLNTNKENINTCCICEGFFLDNGWGKTICSRTCNRIYEHVN